MEDHAQASEQSFRPKGILSIGVAREHEKVNQLPKRFEDPGSWSYKVKKQHPLFTTTSNQYGKRPPTAHEMPATFKGQSSKFSEHLNSAGPWRNFSLNIKK
ncbi:hypothetical protein BJ742DRAFT_809812 [Cladochytrium replicatum]|nr:hypothetical protein BJ742DRAFT_809812 [Cladochytrium replicatum]